MKKLLGTCAPLCLLVPQVALAQDVIELDEIIVSATIEPQPISRTGAIVDVIDASDLAASPLSIADALERIVGTSVSANGGIGAASTLRVRGLDTKYLAVQIDGIDVTDPSITQTQFDFGGWSTAGLGRIEVVKGSQSAIYGSEAVAGVIDIRSFELAENGTATQMAAEAGSFGTVSATVGHAIRDENTSLSFSLSRIESDGFSARPTNTEADGFSQTTLNFKGETRLGENVTIGASALLRDATVEIDRSATDATGENTSKQRGGRAFVTFDAFGIEHELSYTTFDSERRDPGGFTTEFDGDRTQLAYLGTTELAVGTLSFGLDRTKETFRTSSESGETVTESVLFEFLTQPSDATDLALSLRYDDNDDFGGTLSGRAALAWRAREDLIVRAVIGNGFRAPSLFERFSFFGDPNLRVEASRSAEFGIEQQWRTGRLEATIFYTEIDDLIQFDGAAVACGSGFGCYNQVPGTTVSKGFELSGERQVSEKVTIFGGYTFTDAKTDDDRLPRVPRNDLTVGLEGQLTDRLSGSASVRHVFDVEASAFAPADNKVGDYTLVGLGLSYAVNDTTEAYLRIENLFDEDYETAGGFNTPGRSVFAGIRASF